MKMKKISTILVLMIFLVSMMPLAFAEGDSNETEKEEGSLLVEEEEADDGPVPTLYVEEEEEAPAPDKERWCVEECIAHGIRPEDCKRKCAYLRDLREDIREVREERREKREERREDMGEELVDAKELIMETRSNYLRCVEDCVDQGDGDKAVCKDKCASRLRHHTIVPMLKEEIQKLRNDPARKEEFIQKQRELKERYFEARQNYKESKKNFIETKKDFIKKRKNFNNLKEEYQECKEEGVACGEKKKALKKDVKPFLLKTAALVLEKLDEIYNKVAASEDIENQAEILEKLDEQMARIQEAIGVIQNLDDDASAEELNEGAKTIREAWARTKVNVKFSLGNVALQKMGLIINKAKQVEKKFIKWSEALEEKGHDVSELNEVIEDYHERVQYASYELQAARAIFDEISSPESAKEKAAKAHEHLRNAHNSIKAGHEALRKIVMEIKKLNRGQLVVETAVAEEVEDESEEEAEE